MGIREISLEEEVPNLNGQRCSGQREQQVKVPEEGAGKFREFKLPSMTGGEKKA